MAKKWSSFQQKLQNICLQNVFSELILHSLHKNICLFESSMPYQEAYKTHIFKLQFKCQYKAYKIKAYSGSYI